MRTDTAGAPACMVACGNFCTDDLVGEVLIARRQALAVLVFGSVALVASTAISGSAIAAQQRQIASAIDVNPHGVVADIAPAPDGSLWYIDEEWEVPRSGGRGRYRIGRITRQGSKTEFGADPIPESYPDNALRLVSIYVSRDGRVWVAFLEKWGGGIARMNADGQLEVVHRVIPTSQPAAHGAPAMTISDMVTGPDGLLWVTDVSPTEGNRIGRLNSDGTMTWFGVRHIDTLTPTGHGALWLSGAGGRIGRIGDFGELSHVVSVGKRARVSGLAVARDGRLWFSDLRYGVGVIDPASGAVERFTRGFTRNCCPWGPASIVPGPEGGMWLALNHTGVGRVDRRGVVTEYPLAHPRWFIEELAAGADGTLWYVPGDRRHVGVITPTKAPPPTVSIVGRRVVATARDARIRVSCKRGAGRCVGRATVVGRWPGGRRVRLGSTQVSIDAPTRGIVTLRLTRAGRRWVRGLKSRAAVGVASIRSVRNRDTQRMVIVRGRDR